MTWTVYAIQTTTGANLGPIDGLLDSWSRVLNGTEQAVVKLPVGTNGRGLNLTTRDNLRAWTEPARMSLALDWDGVLIWCGPIWSRQRDDDETCVTITAAGLASIFTRRKLMSATAPYASQLVQYTGISPATIARRVVALTMARTGGGLPLSFAQGDEADSNSADNRSYYGSDCNVIGEVLDQLVGQSNGPDVDWRPAWADGTRTAMTWTMVTGTLANPRISSSNQIAWVKGPARSGVRKIGVTEDASKLVTDQWARGQGSGSNTMMSHASSAALLNLGWPLLEGEQDYSTAYTQAMLDAQAAGDLATYSASTVQWSLTVSAYDSPALGSYALGDLPTVQVQNDLWIPDGSYGMRIVGYSGDGSNIHAVQVQNASARALDIPGSPADSLPARLRALERTVSAIPL